MKPNQVEVQWQQVASELAVAPYIRNKLQATLGALEAHHPSTANHCRRVGMLAVRIGQHDDLPAKPLFYGGSLHDRGKLLVAVALLDKTSTWTAEDAEALRTHPSVGYDQTMAEGMVVTAGLVVRHHTFQPHGYPEVLPPAPPYLPKTFQRCARVIALADYYDAAHRPNAAGLATGAQIRDKVLTHNSDVEQLVHDLYDQGIFTTER